MYIISNIYYMIYMYIDTHILHIYTHAHSVHTYTAWHKLIQTDQSIGLKWT